MKQRIQVWYDDCPMNPNEWGTWRFVDFNPRHKNYENPHNYFPLDNERVAQRRKGHFFLVSCHEHGCCAYSLLDEGTQCAFDTTRFAGALILVDKSIKDQPKAKLEEYARSFLEEYTKWANGEVYGWSELDEDGEVKESVGGYYGLKSLIDSIKAEYAEFEIVKTKTVRCELGSMVADMVKA